ncbi:MAG: hypothetical protein ABI343_15420 [Burkholderiaceae bacterium]
MENHAVLPLTWQAGGDLLLAAATRMHCTLCRTDERAGTVHMHSPRIGYVMRAVRKL